MTDYDFRSLNDKEFEVLATDLLSLRDGSKYERFKPGRDNGVDGRFFRMDGGEVILQCKHWPSSALDRLIRHVVNSELPKIRKLAPAKYVLAISHALSRTDKFQIAAALHPFVHSPSDILGREDLNDLLSKNNSVELRHYKLWINSSNVLQHLLNKPIQDRSAFYMREIQESARLYVPTENHQLALSKLEEFGTVIITGPAGIGKTTLAEQLALHYYSQGFSFIKVAEEIREAEHEYKDSELQIFYFDDFLGRNYLEALTGHEGTHIVGFMKRILRDKNKRFILTSRTTILNQGKVLIDVLHNSNLERNEFEVSFSSFSEMDKARILYNHIWHSELQEEYVEQLYAFRRYRDVIAHRNFNPRLIRFVTDSGRLDNLPAGEYWPYAKALLENPAKIWENPFDAQHDDFGRAVILLVTLNARAIAEEELAESYSRFISHPDAHGMSGRRNFLQTLRHLTGSMLNRSIADRGPFLLNLFNPSIGDFVVHRYAKDLPSLRAGFCSLRSISSLKSLLDLQRNRFIDQAAVAMIISSILQMAAASKYVSYSTGYIALALLSDGSLASSRPVSEEKTSAALFVATGDIPHDFSDAAEIVKLSFQKSILTEAEVIRFISAACEFGAMSSELRKLAELLKSISVAAAERMWPRLTELAEEYFADAIHSEFSDDSVFYDVSLHNPDRAESNLAGLIEAKMQNLGIPCTELMIDNLLDAFNVSSRLEDYFAPEPHYDRHDAQPYTGPTLDAIDDLFERHR